MPASAVLVALVVVTWPLLAWPLREKFGPRAWMVPPLASLALVPFVVLGAMWARAQPVVDAMSWRCGTGDAALVMLAVPTAAAALVFGEFWARYIAAPPGRQRVDATIRALAVLATAGAAALCVPGIARSMHATDSDGWAASLPRVDDVPPAVTAAAFEKFAWSFYDVRHDPERELWVVTQPNIDGRRPVLALGPALVRRTIFPRDLDGLAPPRGWVAEAVGGVVAAGLALVLATLAARGHRRRASGLAATHLGGGWIALEEEAAPPLHAPEMERAEPGPVIVRPVTADGAAYRTTGAPVAVRVVARGTPESVADAARSLATVGYAMALAIVALACAPLVVS
jgi:hypothetical protein